jgi:glycosyltransferase involved in cell wall biosynthesis
MPLVFMRQGYLGLLDPTQPGACDTVSEARRKVERILGGDRELIEDIKRRQMSLLDTFTWDHCRQAWMDRFVPLLEDAPRHENRRRRIAVMLTGPYRGGTLASAKNVARMLRVGSTAAGAPADIVFGCFRGEYRVAEQFADLIELGITIRETEWQPIGRHAVANILRLDGRYAKLRHNDYVIPRDGANDFLDCDDWLLIGDRTALPLAPIRRYGVVEHDFVQRYVPAMFGGFHEHGTFTTLRGADYVLVTTPVTGEDAVQYAGVARERVTLVPMEFDPPALADARAADVAGDAYIVWPTNSSLHKNHLLTLEALQEFLDDSETIRKVVVTGVNSQLLSPSMELPPEFASSDHVAKARQFLASRPRLLRRLDFRGELPRESYLRLVSRSRFLLHPATYDNGTYAVVEAAWLGVPAVSADYPAMRFIHSYFDLPLTFFRPSSVAEVVAAMRKAELERDALAAALPPRERLATASWRNLANNFWKTVDGLLS